MTSPLPGAALLAMAILALAMLFTFLRLVRGPSLPDRVVALDLLSILAAGIAAAHAVGSQEPLYIRGAIVLALVAFLGAVGLPRASWSPGRWRCCWPRWA
jgi:multicomponent Na+:H+ antiporter subunit F